MPEIVEFVNHGAASITPGIVEKVLRVLPQWKLEFTQIHAPLFPHLVDQLEFLADAVEDTAEGDKLVFTQKATPAAGAEATLSS